MAFDNLESALDDEASTDTDDSTASTDRNPRVKLVPPVVLGGTVTDVMFLGDISAPQNVQGSDDWRDHGDFVITLEDPEVVSGTVFEAAGRRDAEGGRVENMTAPFLDGARRPRRDFLVVQDDWEAHANIEESVEKMDGEYQPVGVEQYGTQFVGEPTDLSEALDATDHDAVDVFVGKDAGRAIVHSIDAAPRKSAFIRDDGEKAQGLVEYPRNYGTDEYTPSEDDPYPRVAAPPVLHPDLQGEQIALVAHYGDIETALNGGVDDDGDEGYRKHYGDVMLETESGPQIISRGDGVLDAAWDAVEDRTPYLSFHEPDEGWGGADDDTESDESGTSTFSALEQATADGGRDESEQTGLTMDDLDADTRAFVEQVSELASEHGGLEAAIGNFEQTVTETQNAGEISDEFTAAELRPLVETGT